MNFIKGPFNFDGREKRRLTAIFPSEYRLTANVFDSTIAKSAARGPRPNTFFKQQRKRRRVE